MKRGYQVNGCTIQDGEMYDGYMMQKVYYVYYPDGKTRRGFDSFKKACEHAKQVKTWVLSLGFQNGQQGGDTICCREEDIDDVVYSIYGDEVAEIADYIEA